MAGQTKSRTAAALEQTSAPTSEEIGSRATAPVETGSATSDRLPPEVPLVLDGEVVDDPARLQYLHGSPLYYTPLRDRSGVALGAFTRREAMLAASREGPAVAAPPSPDDTRSVCTTNPDSLSEFACFFEHMHFGGDRICLGPHRAYPDLTQGDWNDVISSVDWCRWDVSLFEHIRYTGAELYLAAGCDTPYLEALGWNDTASSAVNWGERF